LIVLVFEAYGLAAILTKLRTDKVEGTALMAKGLPCGEWVYFDGRTAILTIGA
jgi:hypothetical protein